MEGTLGSRVVIVRVHSEHGVPYESSVGCISGLECDGEMGMVMLGKDGEAGHDTR